jgi:DegV family protein with EDD domain
MPERQFILSCESTVDLPYAYVAGRDIPILFYSYMIGEETFVDDMGKDPESIPAFYRRLEAGALPTTAQLNAAQYEEFLEPLLQKGDVLHIVFGTGMTSSYQGALLAAETLREKYPERKLVLIDSLCSSSGYGMLVDDAADLRDQGTSIEDVAALVDRERPCIHHQFFSTDLKFFRRSGRVSGPAAAIATVLNICPIMRLDDRGRIIAYDKVRGKKAAIARTVDTMEQHAVGGRDYAGKCFVCHSNCLPEAEATAEALRERFPKMQPIRICDIGCIIAAHAGPGTVAAFFLGDPRAPEK